MMRKFIRALFVCTSYIFVFLLTTSLLLNAADFVLDKTIGPSPVLSLLICGTISVAFIIKCYCPNDYFQDHQKQ